MGSLFPPNIPLDVWEESMRAYAKKGYLRDAQPMWQVPVKPVALKVKRTKPLETKVELAQNLYNIAAGTDDSSCSPSTDSCDCSGSCD